SAGSARRRRGRRAEAGLGSIAVPGAGCPAAYHPRSGEPLRRAVLLALILLSPSSFAAERVESLLRAGRLAEAIPLAEAEARAAPTDLDAQERYLDLLLTLGLPRDAETFCRERVAVKPGEADAHYLLGRALQSPQASRVAYEHALRIDPEH